MSVRTRLLAAVASLSGPMTPIGVVNTATFTGTTPGGQTTWTTTDLAIQSGTVTQVDVNLGVAGNVAIFTIDPTTNTVRAIGATVAGVVGVNSYVVSLAIVAGDAVGVWYSGGTALPRYVTNASAAINRANAAVKPVPTDVLTPIGAATTTRQLVMRSTGTT